MCDRHVPLDRRTFLQATGAAGTAAALGTVGQADGDGDVSELLVGYSAVTAAAAVEDSLPDEVRVVRRNEALGYLLVEVPGSAYDRLSTAARIASVDGVRYTEDDAEVRAMAGRDREATRTPDDPRFGDQYAPQQVNAPRAWETTRGDGSVTIAVVDQGVMYDHPDLEAQFGERVGRDFVEGRDDPYPVDVETEYHGTHVAGIAAATTGNGEGIAGVSDATLLSARALDADGRGDVSDIADAVQWAADRGADVINLSLGGGGFNQTMKNAVSYAVENDALPVCAAGNSGIGRVAYPARYDECVAVGALTSRENLAHFSQYGENLDVVAPGTFVLSCWTEPSEPYSKISGTSMACPVVSGAAALAKSVTPGAGSAQLRGLLKGTAVDVGLETEKQGYGRVDAARAVESDVDNFPPDTEFTVSPPHPDPGESVEFDAAPSRDPEGPIERFEWTFGDGSTGSGETVTHTYEAGGEYEVTLTTADAEGKEGRETRTVAVEGNRPPRASITPRNERVDAGEEIYFRGRYSDDPDGSVEGFEWDFGDEATEEGEFVHHSYEDPGEYTVELTATDDDGATDTATTTVTVEGNEPPTASFAVSTTTPDPGENVEFDASYSSDPDGALDAYRWEYGDGSTGSGETPSHAYDEDGEYTVELTVEDEHGATDAATRQITVREDNAAPTARIEASDATVAPGTTVTFDGSGSADPDGRVVAREWRFGDGGSAVGETVDHTYHAPGEYAVELTVTDDEGATDTANVTVEVREGEGGDCGDETTRTETGTVDQGDTATFDHDPGAGTCEVTVSLSGPYGTDFDLYLTTDGRTPTPGDYDYRSWNAGSEEEIVVPERDLSGTDSLGIAVDAYTGSGEFTLEVTESGGDGGGGGGGGGDNQAPTAAIRIWGDTVEVGSESTFDAAESFDPDGRVSSYEWEFGDGTTATGERVRHAYESPGTHEIRLSVTDDEGATDTATRTVAVESDDGGGGSCGDETASTTETGTLDGPTDGATFTYDTRTRGPCEVTVSLSGPPRTDFDLYVTTDGRTPTTGDYDYRSWNYGSDEEVVVAGDDLDGSTTLGVLVDSNTGSGEFTLELAEVGTGDSGGPANDPPRAVAEVTPTDPFPAEPVTFDATRSTDPDGAVHSYEWSFGDGETDTGSIVSHSYGEAGEYEAELAVTDAKGATDTDAVTVEVGDVGGGSETESGSLPASGVEGTPSLAYRTDEARGRLSEGDRTTFVYAPTTDGPREVTITLDGPERADFDLYATLDGTVPDAGSYDRSSTTRDSSERIIVDDPGDRIGIAVVSWAGSGEFVVRAEETGRR